MFLTFFYLDAILQLQQSIQYCFNMTFLFAGTAFNQVIEFASNDKHFNKTLYGLQSRSPIRNITLDISNHRIIYSNSKNIYVASQNQTTQEMVVVAGQQQIVCVDYIDQIIRYCLSDGSIFLKSCNIKLTSKELEEQQTQQFISQKHNKFTIAVPNSHQNCYLFCGNGVVPILCNLNTGLLDWFGKNVKNDYLDLQVPIKDVDAKIIRQDTFVSILNADRKLRLYDVRGTHRRPVQDIALQITPKSQMTKMRISSSQNEYFFSNDIGQIYKCDSRKDYKVIGKYKGINSSVTDFHISTVKNELVASSLDSYVRIFDLESCKLIKKYYLNKPIYSLGVLFDEKEATNNEEEGQEEEINLQEEDYEPKRVQRLKQIRKRNKVGLKYLQPREFDEPQVKKEQVIQKQWYQDLNPIDRRDFEQ